MPQQSTTANPYVINKAKGLNDMVSALKLEDGYISTGINSVADGDSFDRRNGRGMYWLSDGDPILSIYPATWADGSISYVAQAGSVFYDITPAYSYYFRDGGRFILQSPIGDYWDCTPGYTTGFIFPTVISTPTADPQDENMMVSSIQSIAFQVDGASTQLLSDFQHSGWYLAGGTDELGFTQFTSDVVFTYSSGLSLIIQDSALNNWKFQVSNDGTFFVTTV